MSSYSPPVLGLDTYTPQTPAAHTVERPSGLLGMAFTPEAIEARAAEARLEKQMYSMGGLKGIRAVRSRGLSRGIPKHIIYGAKEMSDILEG